MNSFGEDGLLLYLLKALVPAEKKDAYSYLDSMGIGLWYGLLKAWLDNKMADSVEEVQKKIVVSLFALIQKSKGNVQ